MSLEETRVRQDEEPGVEDDPALERILRDRKPGEIETGMMSGSDDWDISSTDRFRGDLSEEEALEVLDPGARHDPSP
jgi:hypothetical protein